MSTTPPIATTPVRSHSVDQRGIHITTLSQGGIRELHITILPQPGEHFASMLHRLAEVIKEHDARIIKQQIFAPTAIEHEARHLIGIVLGKVSSPVTWIESGSEFSTPIAGMHVFAIAGAPVTPIVDDEKVIGCSFQDHYARHLFLGDLVSGNVTATEPVQTRQLYKVLQNGLDRGGMTLTDIARTWFFLTNILTWYDAFNSVRNRVYSEATPRPPFLPASTGVGIPAAGHGALLVEAYAMQALNPRVTMQPVESPLQCAATKYGSSFCRALEITTPETRRIIVSGTASIDGAGRTLHVDDMACQVDQTVRVVEGIFRSRKLSWHHVSRATAYFKNIADASAFTSWCDQHQLPALPVILTQADICRDDLLFEIELDAIC